MLTHLPTLTPYGRYQHMFIYAITNHITNKRYVGQTKRTIDKRFRSHLSEAKSNKYQMYLHKSIRKYGPESFTIELIEECDVSVVYEREIFWIRELNTKAPNGYNEHEGGRGGCLNPTTELRKKLSNARMGKPPWNKGLKNVQNYNNPERSRKISEAQKRRYGKSGPVDLQGGVHTPNDLP